MDPSTSHQPRQPRPRPGSRSHPGLLLPALLLLLAAPGPSPAAAQGHELTVDATVLGVAVAWARPVAPGALLGIGAGVALPRIGWTLEPDDDEADFGEYLHLAGFVRLRPAPQLDLDVGIRAALADLWPCAASDCLPVPFAGLYAEPMARWGRLRIGARAAAGWIGETPSSSDGSTYLVALNPLLVRLTF